MKEIISMEFGNWTIDQEGIKWTGDPLKRFVIPADTMNRTTKVGDQTLYDWIMLATNEFWLTQNDLYDLNFAFVYASAKFGKEFNYAIFDATLADQYEQFDEEEEEE